MGGEGLVYRFLRVMQWLWCVMADAGRTRHLHLRCKPCTITILINSVVWRMIRKPVF